MSFRVRMSMYVCQAEWTMGHFGVNGSWFTYTMGQKGYGSRKVAYGPPWY